MMDNQQMNRRRFFKYLATAGSMALLAACGGPAATEAPTSAPAAAATSAPAAAPTSAPAAAPTSAPAAATTAPEATAAASAAATSAPAAATGATAAMPADAAPPEYQVFVTYFDNTADFTTLDLMESVYKRGGATADILSDALVRLDKDFKLKPSAALKWTANSDSTQWTFDLDPNAVWSDGTPVTADDFVSTFRYAADPKHAWDFAWYYSAPGAIKGWDDVLAGKIPPDQLGVKATGPNTLVFETATSAPFLPAKLLYSAPLQKKALEAHGGTYNSDTATTVSSGPYILKEWKKGERLTYVANTAYKGSNVPRYQKLICIGAKPETFFAGYQSGEIEYMGGANLQTADNEIVKADPELSKEVKVNAQDFRTDYLFFDTKQAPFDNLKVRQAISHIIDRDTLIQQIITPSQGIPAYSYLMPGFPASNSEGLKDIQSYDPAKAKALLAEAGFPNGQGFPKLTLWLRNESAIRQALAQGIAATIKQELGIEVEVANKENKTFTEAMNAKPTQIQFGMVSYGMDFLDPSNMLGVWLGSGRHNWKNAEFDKLVNDAAASSDQTARIKQFQDAEKLLVSDVGGVFIYHRLVGDLIKPYVSGDALQKNAAGYAGLQWPGFSTYSESISSLYNTADVTKARTSPPE